MKKLLVCFLLISFCGGEQTQAEICEEYWYIAGYEIELLSLSVIDLQNSIKLYEKDELSEGILYARIQEQIDNVDDHIETISDLTPNETNELYHKRLLTNLKVMQYGLMGFEKWISDSGTVKDRFDAEAEFMGGMSEILQIKIKWTCPTD